MDACCVFKFVVGVSVIDWQAVQGVRHLSPVTLNLIGA